MVILRINPMQLLWHKSDKVAWPLCVEYMHQDCLPSVISADLLVECHISVWLYRYLQLWSYSLTWRISGRQNWDVQVPIPLKTRTLKWPRALKTRIGIYRSEVSVGDLKVRYFKELTAFVMLYFLCIWFQLLQSIGHKFHFTSFTLVFLGITLSSNYLNLVFILNASFRLGFAALLRHSSIILLH